LGQTGDTRTLVAVRAGCGQARWNKSINVLHKYRLTPLSRCSLRLDGELRGDWVGRCTVRRWGQQESSGVVTHKREGQTVGGSIASTMAKSEDSELSKMEVRGKVQAASRLCDVLLLRG